MIKLGGKIMAKGRVYIVKNPLFPTLFKIGFTTKKTVEERGLNASNLPEAFQVIREYECDDYEETEKLFHDTFEPFRYYSQLDGRGKQTEFFSVACLGNAVAWMDKLKGLNDITDEAEAEAEAIAEAEEETNKDIFDKSKIVIRRSVFDFYEMGIPKGASLQFVRAPSIHVKVIDNKQVEYNNKPQSFSLVTAQILKSRGKYVHPTPYWTYEGKNLRDIYNETYPTNAKT
jgi:hypothetical protein